MIKTELQKEETKKSYLNFLGKFAAAKKTTPSNAKVEDEVTFSSLSKDESTKVMVNTPKGIVFGFLQEGRVHVKGESFDSEKAVLIKEPEKE